MSFAMLDQSKLNVSENPWTLSNVMQRIKDAKPFSFDLNHGSVEIFDKNGVNVTPSVFHIGQEG